MKILYYHQYFSTPSGAAGTRSYSNARALVEAGHHVQMICLSDARSVTGLTGDFSNGYRTGFVDGIEVIEFDLAYSNHDGFLERTYVFIRYSFQSLKFALRSDADLIFATTTPLTAGIPGIVSRWLRGTPFVFEVRDLWPELPRAMGVIRNPYLLALLSSLEWLSYHSADACIGLAPGICEGIADRGIPASSVSSIPNACDLDLFRPPARSATKHPELIEGLSLRLPPSSFVAAFTGAHGLANGLDSILDTAALLIEQGRNDIQFLFVGDGRCKPLLEKRVSCENLFNCHFLPPIPKSQLAILLRRSVHVGLMVLDDIPAFYRGTSPNKFFDYLSSGLPVINNYPGWLADMINNYSLGRSVRPRDPSAFANALISLADQQDLLVAYGNNSRRLAESQFSRSILTDQLRALLEHTSHRFSFRRHSYLSQQAYSILKTLADRLFALIALCLLSPLLFVVFLLVRFRLGAPVFFSQQRPGHHQKPFLLFKFRTMTNAYDSTGVPLSDNLRLTPFGQWLRSTSIDELPGLINILRGEMSFIGPRPLLMDYLPLYSSEQIRRHDVKPGFSGWAQINGRNSLSWQDKFKLDVWYVQHRSLLLDLRILLLTIIKVIRRDGISAVGHPTMLPFTGNPAKE